MLQQQTNKLKEKRDRIKVPFNIMKFLIDHRLSINSLSIRANISRNVFHRIKNNKEITIQTLDRLKELFDTDFEKYITDNES